MGDAENNQPSKKRAAGVQLSRENPGLDDNEDTFGQETGTFKKASDEVLATRRIVKVRRQQTPSAPSSAAPSAPNPFAAVRLVPSVSSSDNITPENKADEPRVESSGEEEEKTNVSDDNANKQSESKDDDSKDELNAQKEEIDVGLKIAAEGDNSEAKDAKDEEKDDINENGEENTTKNSETAPFTSFQNLSSGQNAFSGITGTGFSSTSFSFGSLSKGGDSNSIFGGLGVSSNENSSIFGASVATTATTTFSKNEGSKFPPMQEVSVETGEENEKSVFSADSILFEYVDGGWKERGKGEVKVNVSTTGTGKARLVMRARGIYRLLLNASLFPDMKLTNMEKKGITFACVNSADEGKDGLSTIALKFKDPSFVDNFRAAVMEHKDGKSDVALKSPENSPKASDE